MKGSQFTDHHSWLKSVAWAAVAILQAALVWAAIFSAILAEQDIREFKYSDGWWKWQHERALAEFHAEHTIK